MKTKAPANKLVKQIAKKAGKDIISKASSALIGKVVKALPKKKGSAGVGDGMKTFAFHASDPQAAKMVASLKNEVHSVPMFTLTAQSEGGAGASAVDPETAARGYLRQALASSSVPALTAPKSDAGGTDFKVISTETISLTGTTMVKFRQRYNDIPVYGSLVSVELDDNNELVSMNSALGEPKEINPVAKKSPADAMNSIKNFPGYKKDLSKIVPKLKYYFGSNGKEWHLAYIAEDVPVRKIASVKKRTAEEDGAHIRLMDYVVDAQTGKILAELSRNPHFASVQESGKDALNKVRQFRADQNGAHKVLFDSILNIRTFDFGLKDIYANDDKLPGALVTDPPKWSPAAVSAHANAALVATYLRDSLKRKNIDDKNGTIVSIINCDNRDPRVNDLPSPQWLNAVWNPKKEQMMYGQVEKDGGLVSLAIALEVVGHEMFHGVTNATSRLVYDSQSGALNESYSDIAGAAINNVVQPDPSKWDWTIGKGFGDGGKPLRDLSNPRRFGQPDNMKNFLITSHDEGGVHTNSGIHNKAAYLVFTAKDGSGKSVFSPEQAMGIFYLTVTQQLSATSGFSDARRGAMISTQSLFRTLPPAEVKVKTDAVAAAFTTVGIK